MTVNKGDVVRIVKAGASDEAEKNALLAIAGEKPGLWDGLLSTMMHNQHKGHLTRHQAACQPCLWLEDLLLGMDHHCSPMGHFA